MRPRLFAQSLKTAILNKHKILVKGAPGVGKSEIIESVCDEINCKVILMHPVTSDETDFKGLPWKLEDQDAATFLPFGELKQMIDADRPTVCFIDDVGQARPAVQAAAMQLLQARRVNGHKISDDVSFMAATNRKTDKAAVAGVIEPVKTRFHTILELEPDPNDWVLWAHNNGLPADVVAFIQWRPEMLFDFKPTMDLTNSPCPRSVTNLAQIVDAGYPREAELELYTGSVGEGFATEFMAFQDVYRHLPNPKTIILDPEGADVPDASKPNVSYALCGALAEMASANNFKNILKYSERLPKEFSVLLIKNTIRRKGAEIQNMKCFNDWFIENQDVVL